MRGRHKRGSARPARPSRTAAATRKLHKRLHPDRTFDGEQVDLNEKAPISGAFAEPSDGLEPSTPPYHEREERVDSCGSRRSRTRLPVSAVGAFGRVLRSGASLMRPHQGGRRRLQCRNGLRPAWLRRLVGSSPRAPAASATRRRWGPRSVACRGWSGAPAGRARARGPGTTDRVLTRTPVVRLTSR
jgi:hypothetical protein